MIEEEKEGAKYLVILEHEYDAFDDQILSLDVSEELKQMQSSMIDKTNQGYYCCKSKGEELYNECMLAHTKYCKLDVLVT